MARTLRPVAFLSLTLALALPPFRPATGDDAKPEADAAYRQEVESWRKTRVEGLKREDGWFTLVGLFWLDEGENRFGSASSNKVLLPEGKAPAVAGTLARKGDAVRVRVEPGTRLTHDGKPVTELDLKNDLSGEPTVLQLGSVSFFVIKRGERIGVRVKDTEAEALKAFHGLDNYAIDPSWRVTARFEPYQPPRQVPIPNVLGTIDDTPSPGAVVFEREGKSWRLEALEGSPDGGLFLIFADQTNGKETYGAGRFLYTDPPKDGKVVLDFNKAYNPPCAFSAYATCPLPPRENRLALRVEAGEKKYGDH
jgi:uncharacterized protein (DUF1684 family)